MATHSRNRDRGFPNAESFKAIRSLSWVGGISEEGVNGISASFKFKLNRSLMWLNGLVKTHSANSQGQKPRWPKEKKEYFGLYNKHIQEPYFCPSPGSAFLDEDFFPR